MTQQIPDRLRLMGTEYIVLGVKGQGLFDPSRYGLKVHPYSTACYRGFHCGYMVTGDGSLVLEDVYLGLGNDEANRDAILFGRRPEAYWRQGLKMTNDGFEACRWQSSERRLTALLEPMNFGGGILIGTGWLQGVRELRFQEGRLVNMLNGTAIVDRILDRPRTEGIATISDEELSNWKEILGQYGHNRLVTSLGWKGAPTEETCAIEVVAIEGLPDGFAPFKIYVDGYIRGLRSQSEDTEQRQVIRLKPGNHRIVVRGQEVSDPRRLESNTLHFDVRTGDRFRIEARMSDGQLVLSTLSDPP